MNVDAIVENVDAMIPCVKSRGIVKSHQMTVMVGACYELPKIRPSSVEIGNAIGVSHAVVLRYKSLWESWDWRTRHAWLLLTEERIRNAEKPVDAAVCG